MSHGFGKTYDAVRGCKRNCLQTVRHLSAGCKWQAAGLWRVKEVSGGSALERLHFVLRVLPRGQRCWHWSQPPDRMDWNNRSRDGFVRPREREGLVANLQGRSRCPDDSRASGRERPPLDAGRQMTTGPRSLADRI